MSNLISRSALLDSLIHCQGLGRKACELVAVTINDQPTASDKEIRDKAIDEFADKIKRFVDCGHLCSPTELRWTDLSVCKMIDKIAEQMKEE